MLGHRKALPSTSFLRRSRTTYFDLVDKGVPALEMGVCATLSKQLMRQLGFRRNATLCGAKARVAYDFMDFYANSRTVATVLQGHRKLFHDFQLEIQFFAAEDRRQIEFPELAREAEAWPALIEINHKLNS